MANTIGLPGADDSSTFYDKDTASIIIKRMESEYGDKFARLLPRLLGTTVNSSDPARALVFFERFIKRYGEKIYQDLENNPRALETLVTLFSGSHFLSEILIKNTNSLQVLFQRQLLTERKSIEKITAEASEAINQVKDSYEGKLNALRQYQHLELLRIGTSDLLNLYDLRSVTSQLSRLAIGILQTSLSVAVNQTKIPCKGFAVMALGKLGGRELNYSSDIDLVFICKENPGYFTPLAEEFIGIVSNATAEGFLYRIDIRLRPWGKDGPLINTLASYHSYVEKHARQWEKQALLKSRSIAGDLSLGESFRRIIEPHLFTSPDEEMRASVFSMKQQTEELLKKRGREWGEVKLGVGSIRDIEFVVQYLQVTHPYIRTRATLKAIPRLAEEDLLTHAEAQVLTDGYVFFRTIEHYLQIMNYQQTNQIPFDQASIFSLARRLGFDGHRAGDNFVDRYNQYCKAIRAIFLRYISNERGSKIIDDSPPVMEHMARLDISYKDFFLPEEIIRHTKSAQKLNGINQAEIQTSPIEGGKWNITIIAYDYPGELSIICGLMVLHGMNILDGNVFTYETNREQHEKPTKFLLPDKKSSAYEKKGYPENKRKIVDQFTVKSIQPNEPPDIWEKYRADLLELLRTMQEKQSNEALSGLAVRVGEIYQSHPNDNAPLLPIEISIENNISPEYTALRITGKDTFGFLYELTNALALLRIYISRMYIRSVGSRVEDILYVTDDKGKKITNLDRQRELRTAIVLIKHFTHLLPQSPNPGNALLHFREFLVKLFQRVNWPDDVASIDTPEVLKVLTRALGISDYLWNDLLRMQYANLFPIVRDVESLEYKKSKQQMGKELSELMKISKSKPADWRRVMNEYKDHELFRIDMRHVAGQMDDYWDFSFEISDLAEIIIIYTYQQCVNELLSLYGKPISTNGKQCSSSILALGKCGGQEMGFASDIELLLIYDGTGETAGPERVTNNQFFEKLITLVANSIQTRQDGIFHIDLQLRPYGEAGSLAVTMDAFRKYYSPDGPAWAYERQSLIKLRHITGSKNLSGKICSLRDKFVYHGSSFDTTAMRAMRDRQIRHSVIPGRFNAKFSPGALVDLEYLIQGLQINHGGENHNFWIQNTRAAMLALFTGGILSDDDLCRLQIAHTFYHQLIDALRMVHGKSADINVPRNNTDEYLFLARRLFVANEAHSLQDKISQYPNDVLEISSRLLK